MAKRVALEAQGRVSPEELASLMIDAGATSVEIDRRSGDPSSGVDLNFFIECQLAGERRTAFGFIGNPSSENEDGWTRLELGANEAARALMLSVAQATSAWFIDERNNETARFDANHEPMLQLAASVPGR